MAPYDAFISYSHLNDKPIAAALQAAIQKLGKPWYRRRALRLFRDDTSLSATPHLWPTIEQALGRSGHFLLLASPEAAASKWVNKEASFWLEHNSVDTLLIGLTEGDLAWNDSVSDFSAIDATKHPLPPALAKKFSSEPKWVDLRAFREGATHAADTRDAKFTELAADFAAAIRGVPKEDLLSQEVLQQRRALRLAVSAAASLLVLALAAAVAGILAYREQQEAVAQRNRAELTLAAATKTANSLVFDLARRFKNAIGLPAALIKDILDRSLALQQQLTMSGEVAPDLKRSEAAALIDVADLLLDIGDTNGALIASERSRQIGAELLAASPDVIEYQFQLSVSYERVGDVRVAQGDLAGALKSYRDSLAIRERLVKTIFGDATWQSDLAGSYAKIGLVLMTQGDLPGALDSYRKKLAIAERLAQSDPGNADRQRDLSSSYVHIGDVLLKQSDLAGALKLYRDALAVAERLARSDPGNADPQRDLSIAYERVGDVQVAQDDFVAALKSYGDGLAIAERLAQSDPGNAGWQRDLSISYESIGDVQVAQGDLAAALKSYRDSLAIRERLAQSDPANIQWQLDLVETNYDLAVNGDDAVRRFTFVADKLKQLQAQNGLNDEQMALLKVAEAALSTISRP
jgi:tetratricopeptide (TPR) repeat protein